MLDKVKVTITREDGSPICGLAQEADTVFLTDAAPFLLVRKNGGTVEAYAGDLQSTAELFWEMTD